MNIGIQLAYLVASVLFILGIKYLGKTKDARKGNVLSAVGMLIAIAATLFTLEVFSLIEIGAAILVGAAIGLYYSQKVAMTKIPEMVALFNGFGGLASFSVALSDFFFKNANEATSLDAINLTSILLSVLIGGVTFTGSMVAYLKLDGKVSGQPITFSGQHLLNLIFLLAFFVAAVLVFIDPSQEIYLYILVGLALLLGILTVIPIGGADMPVVISLLNSLSGIAAAFAGLLLLNNVLIVAGSLVGASGLILTIIMAKAMNRTIGNILFVGYASSAQGSSSVEQGEVKPITADDAYLILENASSVLVVPGYGMAVAQAQHVVREMGELLEENGTEVKYGIHPVAGRMPGHMNVLLAEANVSYDLLAEPDDVNPSMDSIDVAIVIGANDVVNPSATEEEGSPIYGMPIIEVHNAKTVFVLKRSMSSGFAGVQNPLFFRENTRMLFGDAKESIGLVVSEFKD